VIKFNLWTLEIIALLGGCKLLGDKVRERGRRALEFQVMLVALCFVGDFVGVFVAMTSGVRDVIQLTIWGLFGASWGAAITFKIVMMLPDLTQTIDYTSREFEYAPNLESPAEPADPSNPYASPRDQ
jgi:hypothetical protein